MKYQWTWVLLTFFAVLVVLSYLYFEVALSIKLFIKPIVKASGDLSYHEGLGLFAPVIYMFEGGVKVLEGLSSIVKSIQEVLFAFNSVLLLVSLIIARFVFKRKIWAAVMIVLLSIIPLVVWLDL